MNISVETQRDNLSLFLLIFDDAAAQECCYGEKEAIAT